MGLALGILAMLAAAVLWLLAFRERRKANPNQKIPHFSSPPSGDRWALAYLLLGAGLLGATIGYLSTHLPFWVVLLMALAVVTPPVTLTVRHNRQIHQTDNAPTRS